MKNLEVPFNISLLTLDDNSIKVMRPVLSLDVFDGVSKNFHPDGLYSAQTFGTVGSDARYAKFSYIDLKITILHPVIFKSLVQIKALYNNIIFGREFAIWDSEISDFVRSNAIEGRTGYFFFMEYWKKIVFEKRESSRRDLNVDLIEQSKDNAELSRFVVIPAGYRDIEVDDSGRESSDEINALYYKLIAISNTIDPKVVKISPNAYNTQRASLQQGALDIYDMLSKLIEGKKNLLMGKWASRKIFNGTRNVITSMKVSNDYLGAPNNIGYNRTAIGIYQCMKGLLPVARYQLKQGFLSTVFSNAGAPALLVNKNTLMSERVPINSEIYDRWMTNEGLEKSMTNFKENSIRHDPIYMDKDHYLGLMYLGPDGTFKIIHGIDELPENRNKEDCKPLSLAELFYCSIYDIANNYPIYVTRYPITGIGSIYPSKVFLKSTIESEIRKELGNDWRELGPDKIAYEFPTNTDFFNSLSPHSAKLGRLSAD